MMQPLVLPSLCLMAFVAVAWRFRAAVGNVVAQAEYAALKLFSLPFFGKVAFLLALVVPIVLIGGWLHFLGGGTEALTDSCLKVFHTVIGADGGAV